MRRVLICLAVLLFCVPVYGADYFHMRDSVTSRNGSALSGVYVYVYVPNTVTPVTAYTDLAGTTAVSWPLVTDNDGMFDCYVAQGNYDILLVHSGYQIDTTWNNYMVGSGSDTLTFNELDVSGTITAGAFDADDWIDADGLITGTTLETSGLTTLGGPVTTGGTVDIGGGLNVESSARFAWDTSDEVYSFRISPNVISIEPVVEMHDDVYVYANVLLFGKDSLSGKLSAQNVECDTLKADDLYVRAADGQNDATLHGRFFQLEPVDISVSLPDTTGYEVGTLMFCSDDSFRYLAGAGIAKEWRTLGYAGYVAGEDNPALYLPTTELNYAYADSHVQKFGVGNSGDGILSWESSFLSDWIADAANDTGNVGAGYDSVTVQLMWAQIDSGASLWDTVAVATDYGNSQVVIHADGKPLVGGGDYVVEPNHPRLYFNENEIAGIRTKCKSAELTFYTGFIDWVDDYAVPDDYPLAYVYQQGQQLGRLAFAYAIEQDTTYLHEAVLCGQSLFDDFTTTWYDDDYVQEGMSLFYDWCYDGMGATRKALFGDSLAVACKRQHDSSNYSTNAAHSQIVVISDVMPMALAIAGDGLDDATATAALDSIYAHTFGDHHMCAILDSIGNDGGGYEGDYSEGTMAGISTLFWLWDHGTDKDPWSTSSNMTGFGDYMLYDTGARTEVVFYDVSGPYQNTLYGFGEGKQGDSEAHAGGCGSRMRPVQRLAAAYQDSTLMWLSDQYDTHTSAYQNKPSRWKDLVMRDTLMTAVTPTAAGYTSAKQFDVGTVFMRSGWSLHPDSTDIWATYRHEQYPFGHAHADAGHFIVGRGHDLLLIDSGEYYNSTSDHHKNYMKQTIAHNAITIKDFDETFLTHENSGGQNMQGIAFGGEHPLTLGAYADSMAGADGRGSITTYAHRADTLTYIRSDLTDAYSSSKVDTVRREFVWMEPDGVFLVFDYADVDSTGFLQKSLFHFINNPTFNSGDKTWTVIHGTSEVTLRFLGHSSIDEIGGSGAEFEVNGTNYPLPGTADYHSDNGAYRIEAIMPRDAEQRWLLTIIETSVVGGADYGTVATVEVGDYIGACVNGDTLLFHKYGGDYSYRAQ